QSSYSRVCHAHRTPPPHPTQPNTVTIAAGTVMVVRLGETLASDTSREGDTFLATLDQPLIADGFVIAEKGARAEGRVMEAAEAGRVRGMARLVIELTRVTLSDGQHVALRTVGFTQQGASSK